MSRVVPVVLISGCSSGIGRALAEAFHAAGYQVWAGARQAEQRAALQAAGFIPVALDVNDPHAISEVVARITQEAGRLDVLVNNAGYGGIAPLLDGGPAALRAQFETNVFSLVALSGASFALLKASSGLIVNIGSVSGVMVTPFAGAYCASKAAVHALSSVLRMELAPFGVRVLEVQPGAIASQFGAHASAHAEQQLSVQSAWWPWREAIRARASISQEQPTAAADFAHALVQVIVHKPDKTLVRLGRGAWTLPFLARWLPARLLERSLMRRFGLNQKSAQ